MRFDTNNLQRLTLPLGLMLLIFGMSSIPGTTEQSNFLGFVPPALQNLLHMPLFGLLAWLWYRSLRGFGRPSAQAVALATLVSVLWGVLDEIHQFFVPGRFASLTDMGFNVAGALIVAALLVRKEKE
ncbi:MAG: VanZ family protein [Gammaproteobacteria bacterium]|nr:VanZ family protein [Gammaproteobacteria bacterium]